MAPPDNLDIRKAIMHTNGSTVLPATKLADATSSLAERAHRHTDTQTQPVDMS